MQNEIRAPYSTLLLSGEHEPSTAHFARFQGTSFKPKNTNLVSIVLRFIRSFNCDTNILCLLFGQRCQVRTDTTKVQAGNFFVQMLGQNIHFVLVLIRLTPQLHLRQYLIGKTIGHDKRGMSCSTTKIEQASFGQNDYSVTVRKNLLVNLVAMLAGVLDIDLLDAVDTEKISHR